MAALGGQVSLTEMQELAALYQVTDGLYRATSRAEALEAALDGIVPALGQRAAILLFDKDGVMRFVAWRGLSDAYRARLEGHSPWTTDDRDAAPVLVSDIALSDEPDWVKSTILEEGLRALAFIPIMSGRRVIGKFMAYCPEAHAFTASEVRLAVAIARQLGFSLERERAEAARRAAESELRESEERFRLMSELAPVMIWMSDAEGRCLHLNRLLRDFWGVGDDLAAFDWQTTMHPDDAPAIGTGMQEALAAQAATVIEGRYRRHDGAWRILRTDARPRFAADGGFLGMIGVNVDVTESREAEHALRESEERLRIALEAGRLGTFRFDLTTGTQQWSDRQFEIFGLAPSDGPPSRQDFLALVHPDDLHLVEFSRSDIRTEGTHLDTEFRIVRPDGEIRHLVAHALARFDDDGRPCEVIGVNQDVTEQRRSAAALRASEERLRQFGETSSGVLWIRDAATLQWEYLSPAFDRVYGLSRHDVLRGDNFASWLELVAPADRAAARAHIERVCAGEPSTMEFAVTRPVDGEVRRIRANAFPMRDGDGAVRQIGGIEADVTEERRAAERLAVMVGELQHRTRNLIAVVQSIAAQTLKNSGSLESFRHSFGQRLAALSRVQGLLSRASLEPITIEALVRLELAALDAGDKVSLAGPRVVLCNSMVQTLALALHELATNARKHGALAVPEGRIAVTWERTMAQPGAPRLVLRWLETGIRPAAANATPGLGYGRSLIETALTYSLGARTDFDLSGSQLRCTIELPLKVETAS